jgi:glycosyltransferase involved in cell wall biosynthesis
MAQARRKKILLVANSTWNFFNFRMNLIDTLIARGYEVVLLSPEDQYLPLLLAQINVPHIPLKYLDRKSINPLKEIGLYRELKQIYESVNPDLIIQYTIKPNLYGNWAAKKIGIPSVCIVTGLGYVFLHENWINTLIRKIYKKSLVKADLVVFENVEDKDQFISEGFVDDKNAFAVNGCGINLEYFKPMEDVQQKENKVIFSFVSRLIYDKGIVEFIEAAKSVKSKYPDVEFWVAGEVDEGNPTSIRYESLYEWVESGIIKYFGHVRDVRPIIAKSDCVVLPSYREGLSRALTEAMAMEKPIITCETSGCNTLVEEGVNGYLVPVKDFNALADRIEKFYLLPESVRQTFGQNGREKVASDFSDKVVTSQLMQLIDGLALNV